MTLSYALAMPTSVSLKVYDLRGRVVNTLVAGPKPAGEHAVVWEGVDVQGRAVGSGVYFVRFEAGEIAQSQRIVLIR